MAILADRIAKLYKNNGWDKERVYMHDVVFDIDRNSTPVKYKKWIISKLVAMINTVSKHKYHVAESLLQVVFRHPALI